MKGLFDWLKNKFKRIDYETFYWDDEYDVYIQKKLDLIMSLLKEDEKLMVEVLAIAKEKYPEAFL